MTQLMVFPACTLLIILAIIIIMHTVRGKLSQIQDTTLGYNSNTSAQKIILTDCGSTMDQLTIKF